MEACRDAARSNGATTRSNRQAERICHTLKRAQAAVNNCELFKEGIYKKCRYSQLSRQRLDSPPVSVEQRNRCPKQCLKCCTTTPLARLRERVEVPLFGLLFQKDVMNDEPYDAATNNEGFGYKSH